MSDVNQFIQNRKKHKSTLGDEPGEGVWAVSYADLLMVLMSFFIIFFSLEGDQSKNNKTQAMDDIVYELQTDLFALQKNSSGEKLTAAQSIKTRRAPAGITVLNSFNKDIKSPSETKVLSKHQVDTASQSVNKCLKGTEKQCEPTKLDDAISFYSIGSPDPKTAKASTIKNNKGIMIDFPKDIFAPGAFNLSDKTQAEVVNVLSKLRPHMGKINLVFVGHTDEIPMGANRKVINSNLVLSSLRASKAVEIAIKNGFDPVWVSAQGVGEHNRNSRTLSLRVVMR
jgi:flagellar motor protein MotB